MNVTHHRPQPGGSRTYRIAGGLVAMAVALVMTSAAAADVLTDTAARALVAAAAALPGAGSRLDGFLFLTRDPQWQR